MARKTKVKEINLPMKFNPGLEKYEPVLPLRKVNKKIKIEWWVIIALMILALAILAGFLLLLKYGLIPAWN